MGEAKKRKLNDPDYGKHEASISDKLAMVYFLNCIENSSGGILSNLTEHNSKQLKKMTNEQQLKVYELALILFCGS